VYRDGTLRNVRYERLGTGIWDNNERGARNENAANQSNSIHDTISFTEALENPARFQQNLTTQLREIPPSNAALALGAILAERGCVH
jgi:hypothetical protein